MLKNRFLIIIFIFFLALFTRTFWLNSFPTGITNDELHFILNAKAVYYGFTDMSGQWKPLSLTTTADNPSAELTSPILAPFIGPLNLNLFTSRITFAFISSLLVVVIYLIAFEINPVLGFISAILTIINPWFFYLGRTAFDQPIAIFFLTLTFYALQKLKNNWIYISLIPALLGFYSYIGTKVIFIPYIILVVFFCWTKNKRKYTTQYLIVIGICLLATFHYIYTILTGPSRLGELISPFSPQIVNLVENERSQSSPSILNRIFINRYTIYSQFFIQKYLNSFSPNVMFNRGDETYMLSFWKHGYFYYIDLVFLIIGAYYLFRHRRSYFYIFLAAILLSPIPEAIRRDTIPAYSFHSSLQYPFIIFIISSGIYSFMKSFPKLIIPLSFIYLILFIDLCNLYFFRYPIYQPEGFFLSSRIVSNYIIHERNNNKEVIVITNEPSNLFRQYLFYSQKYTRKNFEEIKKLYQKNRNDITFDHVRFTSEKIKPDYQLNTTYITQSSFYQFNQSHFSIKQLTSGLEMFLIYNSKLCQSNKDTQVAKISSHDFNIEKLSQNDFCLKFISSN